MRSLFHFIYKYHYFILFILLESLSFSLIIGFNHYQNTSFINSSNQITGNLYQTTHSISQYFGLKKVNQELANRLSKIQNTNKKSYQNNKISTLDIYDSIYIQKYQYIPVKVINNSVNKQNNFITLDKGEKHGLGVDMGVVSATGVIGIIKNVSANYAAVVSLLNKNLKISAMVKKNNYFGTFHWEEEDYKYGNLNDLPNHIHLQRGDTIITSGYSSIFPKGEIIGFVSEISKSEGGNFLSVKVKIAADFKNLSNVFVVKNLMKKEQIELETNTIND